jgi:two-component system sporulation sensor kinase A
MGKGQMVLAKRKRLEDHLQENMKRYQTFFSYNTDAIFELSQQGEFLQLNPVCEKVFGYSIAEISKMTFSEVLFIEDLERVSQHFKDALKGKIQNYDCSIIHKSGELVQVNITNIPIIVDDEIVGVYGAAKDITELKQGREKLIQSQLELTVREEMYRNLVEHSPDAVIIARSGEILYVNNTCMRLLEVSMKENIVGKNTSEFFHSADHNMILERRKRLRKGEVVEFIEKEIRISDGSLREVEVMAIPAIYQNKRAEHIIIRDITERKKTQQLLINSEKFNIAGQLAAGIAHEVRNPLTAIKGFIQLLEKELEDKQMYFNVINEEMKRIDQILNELLLLAKPHGIKFAKKDVMAVLEHVRTLIETQALMNNVQITISYKTDIPLIKCEENQLKQVFINIMKNAVEAMPKGGEIWVEVDLHLESFMRLSFKDEGDGIPEEILNRIGEPFFTTKEQGTGLGLMICKQIIENHKGDLTITSGINGTKIEVLLPI